MATLVSAQTDFDAIPITTAVLVCELGPQVNLDMAFPLLPVGTDSPISRLQFGLLVRGKNVVITRGKKTSAKKGFPNAISAKVDNGRKIVDMKICPRKIQMTGAKGQDDAVRAIHCLFALLREVQADIALVRALSDPEALARIGARLDAHVSIESVRGWLCSTDRNVLENDAGGDPITHLEHVMINKNYSIGAINMRLGKLATLLQGRRGFGVFYVNQLSHDVNVWIYDDQLEGGPGSEIPRGPPPGDFEGSDEDGESSEDDEAPVAQASPEKFARTVPVIKFCIHKSGQTTQSGRNPTRMALARQRFLEAIAEVRALAT